MALIVALSPVTPLYAAATNLPPLIFITWPQTNEVLSSDVFLKLKSVAADPDGQIARVQFFAGTNLIGTVTNPPYNLVWYLGFDQAPPSPFVLKAVATDTLGAQTESDPIRLTYCSLCPPMPVVRIVAPKSGHMFAIGQPFVFSAEVLASRGDAGPVEFFVDGTSVGVASGNAVLEPNTPALSVTVTNLPSGRHKLGVKYLGTDAAYCQCEWQAREILVVKLAILSPRVDASNHLQFEVLSSYRGTPVVIQSSSNLHDWTSISTNESPDPIFNFTESLPATKERRFYRAVVLTE